MALRDENGEDEKEEEKPKVFKTDVASDNSASAGGSSRPLAAASDDIKAEKNDVGLEADVLQPCPSTAGAPSLNDGLTKHPNNNNEGSSSSAAGGSGGDAGPTAVNGASPNGGGTSTNVPTATTSAGNADSLRSTAFTRTMPNRINGLDAFMNGFSGNYYHPGLAYFATAAGPSSGGSSATSHGVVHPMASYPPNLPAAALYAHLMGNRFPGSPNAASYPFTFQQGAPPFAGFSPCYPSAPDGGQTAPSQAAAGQPTFPFPFCPDPKNTGIRSPCFAGGQCSPSFGPPLLIQPSMLEQFYARYSSPIFAPFFMPGVTTSTHVPCSPSGNLSPIVNSSPIAGAGHALTPTALAPPTLIQAYPPAPYAVPNGIRFPPSVTSTPTNALAAMSQISLPVPSTSVKSVVTNMVANASTSLSASNSASASSSIRGCSTQNGSGTANVARHRTGSSANSSNHQRHHHHRHDENGAASSSNSSGSGGKQGSSSKTGHHREKASKKASHIKKPLNAFMLYMKEMRPAVMQEVGLKERQSAEINRILGRRWHSLTRDEQQKYYDMARQARTLHMQMYPNWSARDNYALHKKKKRKRDKAQENLEMKKCRARFGLDQQSKWCKHCRRKKKCLWFREGASANSAGSSSANQAHSGSDSAEPSPPCAQVTSTTNGPDTASSSSSAVLLAAETDVNSPQSLVTSTIAVPPSSSSSGSSNGNEATTSKRLSASVVSGAAASMMKIGAAAGGGAKAAAVARKKSRRSEHGHGGGAASSSETEDEDGSSSEDEEEFDDDDDEIDEEAEAAAAAKAAAEGAEFDDEMADFASPPSSAGVGGGGDDHKSVPAENDHPSPDA